MIQDAVLTCKKRGADPKATCLWYSLNNNTKIKAWTGAGVTRSRELRAVIVQGMLGCALASQAVLDQAVMEHLAPGAELQPCMWMDDIMNPVETINKARKVNLAANFLVKTERTFSECEKKL